MRKLSVLLHSFLYLITSYRINPIASNIYLRLLGMISILIFYTLYAQVYDLAILDRPIESLLPFDFYPFNIFSFISFNHAPFVALVGIFLSGLLLLGIAPFFIIINLAALYASLLYIFPTFLSYQWDIFYIELLLCSLFLFPPKHLFYHLKFSNHTYFISCFPIIMLCARLFYQSGIVKLSSRTFSWLSYTAMDFHLFSQPMPHMISKYFHQFMIENNLSIFLLVLLFVIELIVPFFYCGPSIKD